MNIVNTLKQRMLGLISPLSGKVRLRLGLPITSRGGRCGPSNSDLALRGVAFPLKRNDALLFSLITTLLLAVNGPAQAATYGSNGSLADLLAKEALCINGDTITLPPGTFTWNSYFITAKAITLSGSGVGKTIVRDNGSNFAIMQWNLVAGKPSRITGIEFQDGGRSTSGDSGNRNLFSLFGSNTNGSTMRVDHCKFDHLFGVALNPNDVIGVIDHNTFLATPGHIPIYAFHKNWNNQGPYSGGSWADSSHFGTSQFLFIEDNTFVMDTNYAVIDCYGGARWVFRHNNVTRGHLEIHGTELVFRGGRAFEVYNNTFVGPTLGNYIINGRSGIFVVHDNQATGFLSGPVLELAYYRVGENVLWSPGAQTDGTSRWDVNDTEGNGTSVPGHSPHLFYSGTATAGSANAGSFNYPTVTVSGASWTPNQWKGYSILKTSPDVATVKAAYIFENTSNTITYIPVIHPPTISFANGDTFQIHRVLQAMDQCGRSQGAMIPQTDPAAPPTGWNNQITEPCYEWNNAKTEGGSFHFDSDPTRELIRANEHYFNSTVKPGYTPFTYPHPLTTGSAQPNPPSNLRISGP